MRPLNSNPTRVLLTRRQLLENACLGRISRCLLRLTTIGVSVVRGANGTDVRRAVGAVDGYHVTKVGIGTGNSQPVHGNNVTDCSRALDVAAGSAGTVQLAKVVDREAVNYDLAGRVLLSHISRLKRTT